jgi:hypothetical protein
MIPPQNDDEVGYGRPPRHTRWEKGQSGIRKPRRPARPKSVVEIIDMMFLKRVKVTVNGETKMLSTLEAILLQLWLKEVSGNRRALNVRLKFQEFARQNSKPNLETVFVDSEYTQALAAMPSRTGADNG